jgi:aminopeptidase N
MWVHESFANYAENLYTECVAGKGAGAQYVIGTRQNIRNDRPIVAPYGVHAQGSGDMYYKGGNLLHTIRQVIDDDARWRSVLRGLNQDLRHQTVTGLQVQAYISQHAGIDLSRIFTQYLTTTQIPVFEYAIADSTLRYRWSNVVPGFDLPLKVTLADTGFVAIRPTEQWQRAVLRMSDPSRFRVDENFYVVARRSGGG